MSSGEEESLLYVFPEQFPRETLLQKLRTHGINEESLKKDEDCVEDIILCFYQNVSSLPRRTPRDNRRGNTLKKVQTEEDRKRQLKLTSCGGVSAVKCTPVGNKTTARGKSSFAHPVQGKLDSTPEMDRLLARSKVVAESKRKAESNVVTSPRKIVRLNNTVKPNDLGKHTVKNALKRPLNSVKTSINSICKNFPSTVKITKLKSDNLSKVNVKDEAAEKTLRNTENESIKQSDSCLKDKKEPIVEEGKPGLKRRKLNRNSFSPAMKSVESS